MVLRKKIANVMIIAICCINKHKLNFMVLIKTITKLDSAQILRRADVAARDEYFIITIFLQCPDSPLHHTTSQFHSFSYRVSALSIPGEIHT